jgi:hypothetical protein
VKIDQNKKIKSPGTKEQKAWKRKDQFEVGTNKLEKKT